jgi:hypothetical protein
MANKKVVSIADARREKEIERKEAKLADLAERFENAMPSILPTKTSPVKDYLKSKKNKKNKNKR